MSMISELLKDLSNLQTEMQLLDMGGKVDVIERAKECIQMQSEKIQTQNLNGGWILCKDCLPSDDRDVLVKMSDDTMMVDFRTASSTGWFWAEDGDLPVAWMELPKEWKGEQNADSD